jgi:prepilin-type N-terminal cleavage/methylation domain-containing protein
MAAERVLKVPAARGGARRGMRRGMTLAEVMIALVILTVTLVSLGNFAGKFELQARTSSVSARALDLANNRIDTLRHTLTYTGLDSVSGTVTGIVADSETFTRVTTVLHMGGLPSSPYDYKIVSVTVTPASGAISPVEKTISIRSF